MIRLSNAYAATSLAALLAVPLVFQASPAAGQGTTLRQTKPGYTSLCPDGWTSRGNQCEPASGNAQPAYAPRTQTEPCAEGYSRNSGWCLRGDYSLAATFQSGMRKAHVLDRCPTGYFTNMESPMNCLTSLDRPPAARAKGNAPCRSGEVEDWGIWCISNYSGLTRGEASSAVLRDNNGIFTGSYSVLGRQEGSRQPNLPEGSEYSPAYFAIFGRVTVSGSPIGGAATAAAAPAPMRGAASDAPATPTGQRVASLNPQRQTGASPFCPSGWMDGTNPATGAREPGMCFAMPNLAQPSYPRMSDSETCAPGHVLNGTWCSRDPNAPAATAQAQTAPNCPPAGNTGAGQQAGAALGGLLGARRGNSQAGAALGGLIGQAAGGAAQQRPAGCP
jgi:hypothetical protein